MKTVQIIFVGRVSSSGSGRKSWCCSCLGKGAEFILDRSTAARTDAANGSVEESGDWSNPVQKDIVN